jgi:hypothetical protein
MLGHLSASSSAAWRLSIWATGVMVGPIRGPTLGGWADGCVMTGRWVVLHQHVPFGHRLPVQQVSMLFLREKKADATFALSIGSSLPRSESRAVTRVPAHASTVGFDSRTGSARERSSSKCRPLAGLGLTSSSSSTWSTARESPSSRRRHLQGMWASSRGVVLMFVVGVISARAPEGGESSALVAALSSEPSAATRSRCRPA